MNQGGYFGAYQGGFKTLPNGAYEMMTAPTQQLASTITNLAGMAAGAYGAAKTGKAETAAFQQGAGPQYQNVESMSQAYGVPINSTLTEQYKNIGSMTSPQQQAAFQQSLAQEAQRIQAIGQLNYQRQQAAQSKGQGLYKQNFQNSLISAGYNPQGLPAPANAVDTSAQIPIYQGGVYTEAPPNGPNGVNSMLLPPLATSAPAFQPNPEQTYWYQTMGR